MWLSVFFCILGICIFLYLRKETIPSPTSNYNSTYDYIIVGAGAAGSVLANRLTEKDHVTVLVLEAGDFEQDPTYDMPWYAPKAQMTKADWSYYSTPQKHACFGMNDQKQYLPRGKGAGGSTLVNGLAVIRGSRHDYDSWAEAGCTGWGWDDVHPFFRKLEDVQIENLKHSKYRGTGGPVIVTDTTITPVTDVFLSTAEHVGYKVKDCNGDNGNQIGFCRMQAIVGKSVRWHSGRAYLWPAMTRNNLHVVAKTHVTKVIVQNGRAIGIEAIKDGKKIKISASKEVILSAGAIGTPQILLLSGIGPKGHLKEHKIPVIKDLPVGENLQDHVMFFVKVDIQTPISLTPDKVFSWKSWFQYHLFGTGCLATNAAVEATAWICTDPEHSTPGFSCPDVEFIFFSTLAEHGDSYEHFNYNPKVTRDMFEEINNSSKMPEGFSVVIEATHPRSKGSVKLASADPFDYPHIDPNYFAETYDVSTILRGLRFLQKLLETEPMRNVGARLRTTGLSICDHNQPDSDEYWKCLIQHLSVSGYHLSASCKMGPKKDKSTVVDPQLRVHDITGLRIVDASIFPNVTSGNTMTPTYMVAEKAAEIIKSS